MLARLSLLILVILACGGWARGTSYVGLGDTGLSCTAAYGLRAWTAGAAGPKGAKVINVTRASDSTSEDIGTLANGSLDVPTLASFLSGTTGTVTKFYDLIGSNTETVTAGKSAAAISAAGVVSFSGLNEYTSASSVSQAQPFSLEIFASFAASQSTAPGLIAIDGNNQGILTYGPGGSWTNLYTTDGTTNAAFFAVYNQGFALGTTPYAVQSTLNGASSLMGINGAVYEIINMSSGGGAGTGPTLSTNAASGKIHLGSDGAGVNLAQMTFYEAAFCPGLTSAQMASIAANQQAFWQQNVTIAGASELFGGGPFSAANLPQSTGYTQLQMTIPTKGSIPNAGKNVVQSWNMAGATGSNVYSFQNLTYGSYGATQAGFTPWNMVTPKQVSSINTLTVSHSTSYSVLSGSSQDFDIIYDGYLSTGANSGGSAIEFSVGVHIPTSSCTAIAGGFTYEYTDASSNVWYVYENAGLTPHQWSFILKGSGSTCVDIPTYTFDMKGMFNFLVSKGVLTGSEYFGGFGLGVEPFDTSTAGNFTIGSMSVIYNYLLRRDLPGALANDNRPLGIEAAA